MAYKNALVAEAAQAYDNAAEDDAEREGDARAKREDAAWHAADLHDAMYGDWRLA